MFILGLKVIIFNNMTIHIPDISKQVYKEDLFNVLENQYSTMGPLWVTSQMEWMNGVYGCFKNHDKFLIVIYLINKTLDFYSKSFVKLTYDEFYQKDIVEIGKFSIAEIANELNIPKESARRKINELQALGVIKKFKKKIIIDRSSFVYVKPVNTVQRISRFLSTLSSVCVKEKIFKKNITSQHLEATIKANFSYIWKIYYDMQIPMMLNYKKVFKDLETFHIFGTCVVNQHLHSKKLNQNNMGREDFFKTITTSKIQGLNAMSISDITGIPRATAIRKLNGLIKKKNLIIDEKKLYRLTGNFARSLTPEQKNVLDQLANFSMKIFNFSQL